MNTDALFFIAASVVFFLIYLGVYKLTLEKTVKARENIQQLLRDPKQAAPGQARYRQQQEVILKRRPKDEKSFLYRLEIKLERANLLVKPQEFLGIGVGLALVAALFTYFIGQSIFAVLIAGVAGFFLPQLYLTVRIWLRLQKAGEQFADVLDAMVNCFKTGYGFNRAVQVVADNFEDPWGTEFGKMSGEMSLGATQEDALFSLSGRIPSPDVDLFVTALLIQKETGGNMAELLGTLSKTVRERYKLFRKVGAISAQGKLSAGIVICVPFFLMGMMYLFLPEPVMDFVTHPIGIVLMCLAGFWMACGIGVLFKIVQIEV
jgi:tight adherence protein B